MVIGKWTKKSYDALYFWIDASRREEVKQTLLSDGLDSILSRLESAENLGTWWGITGEAAIAVGFRCVAESAMEAERELQTMRL